MGGVDNDAAHSTQNFSQQIADVRYGNETKPLPASSANFASVSTTTYS